MRIGIEGKVLSRRIGGIGRCAINLLQTLLPITAAERPDVEVVIFDAPQTDPEVLAGLNAHVCHRFGCVKSSLLRSALLLPAGVVAERVDIFHSLDQSGMPWVGKSGKYVLTIHDIIPLTLPWAFPLRQRLVSRLALSRVRKQADRVLVPSEAVKVDIMRHLQVEDERIVVIPWGCEDKFRPAGDPTHFTRMKERYGLPDHYVLFVGTLEPRKDVVTLLQAFSWLRAERLNADVKLVIAGGKGWGDGPLRTTWEVLGLKADVIFIGFVDEADLPELYRRALLFVYPSLDEGFGLPILEAMACGTPVITSNTASMAEVAGGAALLVEPKQPEMLAAAMASVLGVEQLRHELRRKGMARAKQFRWDAAARRTLEVYTALAGQ